MSRYRQLFAMVACLALVVSSLIIVQQLAADGNQPDPRKPRASTDSRTRQSDVKPAGTGNATDSIYLDLAAAAKSAQESEDEIRKALRKPITVELKKTPLKDALAHVGDLCGIQTTYNSTALEEDGIALSQPVTLSRAKPLPAQTILKSMLEPLGLTTIVDDETLIVTTESDVHSKLHTRLYDTSRLIRGEFTTDTLAKVIEAETSGPWMNFDGTGGTVSVLEHLISVRSSETVHAETRVILDVLEKIAASPEKSGTAPLHMTAEDRKVYRTLSRRVSLDFRETPLKDVVAFLATLTAVNVDLHTPSLAEEGIEANEPVTFQVKKTTLKSALRRLLEPLGLTYIIEDGALIITTEICAEEMLTTFVFNVRDFAEANYSMDMIIQYIQQETSGPWMDIDATGGRVLTDVCHGLLIVRQTWKNQEEAALLVDQLRATFKKGSTNGKLPKLRGDPDGLKLKQYHITSLPVEDVSKAIQSLVAVDSWKSTGGKGQLAVLESRIIIRQSTEVHQKIEKFLKKIGADSSTDGLGLGNRNGPIGSSFFGAGGTPSGSGLFSVD